MLMSCSRYSSFIDEVKHFFLSSSVIDIPFRVCKLMRFRISLHSKCMLMNRPRYSSFNELPYDVVNSSFLSRQS